MPVRKFSDTQILEAHSSHSSHTKAAASLPMDERSYRRRLNKLIDPAPVVASRPSKHAQHHTYVITAAVNATKAHARYLKSLEAYCAEHDARLMVIPMRYKNPTRRGETGDDEWWDSRLLPYLVHERTKIAPGLVVLADIKIQPTAVNPLQGWLTVSGTDDAILGHTKISLKTVATSPNRPAKIVQTTGAITAESYSDTNAGKKGQFHHTLGAVVV